MLRRDRIITISKKSIDPLNPHVEDICIHDIAQGLSRQYRYSGQAPEDLTVAQHSVIVSMVAPELNRESGRFDEEDLLEIAKAGLIHDAAEAYLNDMVTPVKMDLPEFEARIENPFLRTIFDKFEVDFEWMDFVHVADKRLAATEMQKFWGEYPAEFDAISGPLPINFEVEGKSVAQGRFLNRFIELFPHHEGVRHV